MYLSSIENIVGNGENAGYQHFLLFPQCFHKAFILRVVKSQNCVVNGYLCVSQTHSEKKLLLKV